MTRLFSFRANPQPETLWEASEVAATTATLPLNETEPEGRSLLTKPPREPGQPYGQVPVTVTFDRTVAEQPEAIATYFMGQQRSYALLGEKVARVAKGLQDQGIGPGDRVGLVMPNAPQFIIYYYAVLKLGAVVVNFNPLYTESELSELVASVKPKVLVSFNLKAIVQKVATVAEASAHVEHLVMIPFTNTLTFTKSLLFRAFKGADVVQKLDCSKLLHHSELMASEGDADYPVIDPEQLAILQFTGGTTGRPKAAMLSHRNIAANVEQALDWLPPLPVGSSHMAVLPFFHIFAMTSVMNYSIALGIKMVMMPRFELRQFMSLIDKQKPNVLCAVPTIFQAVINSPDRKKYDLSSLEFCISGGAPLPAEVKSGFETIAGATVVEGYGLSETAPVLTSNPFEGVNKPGSIGLTWPGVELSVRDLEDPSQELPQGQSGELCFRGPNVFMGYFDNPQATANSFVDGYFRTGDVGYVDEEGYIFINDRIKDMIIASGYKVYPRAIEDALYKHEAVAEALVLGVKDEYRGEAPMAYVALKAGQSVDKDGLMDFLSQYLSKIEMPEDFIFRDALPKTLIGKPSRKDLRIEIAAEQKQGQEQATGSVGDE